MPAEEEPLWPEPLGLDAILKNWQERNNDPPWPPLDYIIDHEHDLFTDRQLIEYLSKMSSIQLKAIVVACSNDRGETLLERAVREEKRELATAIIQYGKAQAILTYGQNDASVAAIEEAEKKHNEKKQTEIDQELHKRRKQAAEESAFWMGSLFTQAVENHDIPLLCRMFQGASTVSLFGAREQTPLEAISRVLPRMADLRMDDAVLEALRIGEYNGGGFIRCLDPRWPPFAEIKETKAKGGAYPLPFDADGKSLWEGMFKYMEVQEVGETDSTSSSQLSTDHQRAHPISVNRSDSFYAHQQRKPRGSAVEVSLFRVSLPHLGDLRTLRALVAMGPDAIDIFATPAVNICVST